MSLNTQNLLRLRNKVIIWYRNHETIALFVVKLVVGLILFSQINSVGHAREDLDFANGFFWTVGLSALFAVAPPLVAFILLLLAVLIQISLSLELMAFVLIVGACILLFYCRLQPARSFIIIAMLLGYYLRMPYLVVLLTGLYVGFGAIIPIVIGTIVWNFLPLFSGLAGEQAVSGDFDVTAVSDSLTQIYTAAHARVTGDFGWIFTAFVYAMVVILVSAIARLSINHSRAIALFLGGLLCIVGMMIYSGISGQTAGMFASLVFVMLSVVIAQGVRFFDLALDYKKIQTVEFEDEDNFYYVKIINKLKPHESTDSVAMDTARPVSRPVEHHAVRLPAKKPSRAEVVDDYYDDNDYDFYESPTPARTHNPADRRYEPKGFEPKEPSRRHLRKEGYTKERIKPTHHGSIPSPRPDRHPKPRHTPQPASRPAPRRDGNHDAYDDYDE